MAPSVAPGHAHALAPARLVPRDLSRLFGGDAHHGFLERQPLHEQSPAPAHARQLPGAARRDVPPHHRENRRYRCPRDGDGRSDRPALCLLHGAGGVAAGAKRSAHDGAAPTLGELPRAGIRLDRHPQQRRHPRLDVQTSRARVAKPRVHEHRHVDRVLLHLAPVHGHPDIHRARADTGLALRGVLGPRGAQCKDMSAALCCRSRSPESSPGQSSLSR